MRLPANPRSVLRSLLSFSLLFAVGCPRACTDPVEAKDETAYQIFELDGPNSGFVGDTVTVYVDAQDTQERRFKTSATFSVQSGSARLIGPDPETPLYDTQRIVLQQEGTPVVIRATTTKGRMGSGATPQSTHEVRVTGKIASIRVSAPANMSIGDTAVLYADFLDASGDLIESARRLPVQFETTDAATLSVTPKDNVSAVGRALKSGSVTVRARFNAATMARVGLTGTPLSGEKTVTITTTPTNITFAPATLSLYIGQSAEVNFTPTDAQQQPVKGLSYSISSLTPTTLEITDRSYSDGNDSFTVKAIAGINDVPVTGKVKVSAFTYYGAVVEREYNVSIYSRIASVAVTPPGPVRLNLAEQLAIVAVPVFAAGAPTTPAPVVTWESSAPTRVSVNAQGTVTALGNTGGTPATITAVAEGRRSAPVSIQVGPLAFGVVPATVQMAVGVSRVLELQEKDASGAFITGAMLEPTEATWSSSNTALASVTTAGAVKCEAAGTAVVLATLKNTTLQSAATITCVAPPAANLMTLDPVEYTAQVGQNVALQARLWDAQGNETAVASGYRIVYTVETPSIADIVGQPGSNVVQAKAVGTTLVTATYLPIAGGTPLVPPVTSTLRVGSANAGEVATVRITQTHLLASPGVSQGLTAEARDKNGTLVNGVTFRWSKLSAGTAVGINATTGMATANSTGGETIFASAILPGGESGATGVTAVTVRTAGAVLATVQLSNGNPAGGAVVRAWQGGTLRGTGIVPVDGATAGRAYVPGLAAGTYTITVSLPGYAVRTFSNVVVNAAAITVLNGAVVVVLTP